MIYDVFLPFIIIFSIFSIIIILARKIPDISLEAEVKKDLLSEEAKKRRRATVLFCKALSILEKTLRQLRIRILKFDTKIFSLIQYLRDKSAKKLEEINKLSCKSFAPAIEKKSDKIKPQAEMPVQSIAKPQVQPLAKSQISSSVKLRRETVEKPQSRPAKEFQAVEKDILPAMPVHVKFSATSSPAPRITSRSGRALGYANKISTKFQFKIEERKLLHIIARNPKIAENYKKLGMLYYNNENYLDTEAAFIEYLKLNPSDNEVKEILKKVALKNQGKKI